MTAAPALPVQVTAEPEYMGNSWFGATDVATMYTVPAGCHLVIEQVSGVLLYVPGQAFAYPIILTTEVTIGLRPGFLQAFAQTTTTPLTTLTSFNQSTHIYVNAGATLYLVEATGQLDLSGGHFSHFSISGYLVPLPGQTCTGQ